MSCIHHYFCKDIYDEILENIVHKKKTVGVIVGSILSTDAVNNNGFLISFKRPKTRVHVLSNNHRHTIAQETQYSKNRLIKGLAAF